MRALFSFRIAIVLLLISAWACKSTSEVQDNNSPENTTDRESIYWSRVDSAKMQFVEADVNFMTGMIVHHAQAIIMSRLAPHNGASKQVQTLAARIINSQKDEIQSMQQWLRERNQPVPEVHINNLQLNITGIGDHKASHKKMAGMLSQAQLQELSEARGSEFDRLFLKYMIQHHSGALTMVDTLFSANGAANEDAAFKLATSINADQKTEIARMQLMLDDLTSRSQGS